MKYLILDVETSINNKGNPFDLTNKLMLVGLKDNGIYDIEYSVDPYKELLNDIQIAVDDADVLVGFNIKFDLHWLQRYGIVFKDKRIWDCQLAEFILRNQTQPYPSLNAVAEFYKLGTKLDEVKENYWKNGIDTNKVPLELLTDYLLQDLALTEKVMYEQFKELETRPELKRLISLHNQDLMVLQEMEYNGLNFEYDWSNTLGHELEEQIDKLNAKLLRYHNYPDFNPNSVDHLSAFLYGGDIRARKQVLVGEYKTGPKKGEAKYKWEDYTIPFQRRVTPLKGSELAKEGLYSTDEKTIRSLKGTQESMEILDILLTRATLEKRMSTYYFGLTKLTDQMNWKKGKIHGQLNQCVAKTGRLSSSKPNLQNFDGEIKTLFTSQYGE
jgi:DNA polymerase I-like protein with 3'-5' exonuclease and polymerase domains